jgi:O-antigen/teichoic acid export membrane protein
MLVTFIGGIILAFTAYVLAGFAQFSENILGGADERKRLLFGILLASTAIVSGLQRFITARQKFYFLNRVAFSGNLLYATLLSVWFFYFSLDTTTVLTLMGVPLLLQILIFSVYLLVVRYDAIISECSQKDDRFSARNTAILSFRTTCVDISYYATLNGGLWQTAILISQDATGILRIGINFLNLALQVPRVLGSLIRAKAVSEVGGWERAAVIAKLLFLFEFVIAIVFSATGWFIIPLLFGSEYNLAYPVTIFLLFGVAFWSYHSVLASQINTKKGYPWGMVIVGGGAVTFLFGINWLLLPNIGLLGAGVAFISVTCFLAFASARNFAKHACIPARELMLLTSADRLIILNIMGKPFTRER